MTVQNTARLVRIGLQRPDVALEGPAEEDAVGTRNMWSPPRAGVGGEMYDVIQPIPQIVQTLGARTACFYSTRRRERTLVQLADRLEPLARGLVTARPVLFLPQAEPGS